MINLKFIKYLVLPIIFTFNHVYAQDTTTYHFKIYAKNKSGVNIPQVNKFNSDNRCCWVSIDESNQGEFPDQEAIAKINLPIKRYSPGTKVKIGVDKKWWIIESPNDGVIRLPKDSSETIEVILTPDFNAKKNIKNEKYFFFTVQVFATKYPEKASEISRSLRNRGFNSYEVKSLKPKSESLEYESLVTIGKFYSYNDANKKRFEIIKKTNYKNIFIRKVYE